MNFTKKLSFIRRAQRQQESEGDILEKVAIQDFLRTYHIYALQDKYVVFDSTHGYLMDIYDCVTLQMAEKCFWHRPDLYIKPDIVIEIDGFGSHGGNDELTTTETTRLRNKHYLDAGLKLIVIDKETLKVLGISWQDYLLQELRSWGLVA